MFAEIKYRTKNQLLPDLKQSLEKHFGDSGNIDQLFSISVYKETPSLKKKIIYSYETSGYFFLVMRESVQSIKILLSNSIERKGLKNLEDSCYEFISDFNKYIPSIKNTIISINGTITVDTVTLKRLIIHSRCNRFKENVLSALKKSFLFPITIPIATYIVSQKLNIEIQNSLLNALGSLLGALVLLIIQIIINYFSYKREYEFIEV